MLHISPKELRSHTNKSLIGGHRRTHFLIDLTSSGLVGWSYGRN